MAHVGPQTNRAKLTEAQVLEMRALHPQHSAPEIARRFGVHRSQALLIVNRRSWKHLP